jgi:hypothetical protein
MTTTEVEIHFELDADGRTKGAELDYASQTVSTKLLSNIDDILLDCEIADAGLLPRTFWIDSKAKPRFALEKMALDVLQHQTGNVQQETLLGAEWWVQLRPSPPAGRYALLDQNDESGISFHWDKDEDLRIACGAHVHPHLSTVTYLTNYGGPTLCLNHCVHNLTGEWLQNESPTAFVSWPRQGKHLSFDGRFLHAAPAELMPEGLWEDQQQVKNETVDAADSKKAIRRHRRVTFLVNIWVNYKPFNVEPFPESMVSKMSGHDRELHPGLLQFGEKDNVITVKVNTDTPCKQFSWPLGECESGESIQALLPLEDIQALQSGGGNLSIEWSSPKGVQLLKRTLEDVNSAKRQRLNN